MKSLILDMAKIALLLLLVGFEAAVIAQDKSDCTPAADVTKGRFANRFLPRTCCCGPNCQLCNAGRGKLLYLSCDEINPTRKYGFRAFDAPRLYLPCDCACQDAKKLLCLSPCQR